ncbi:hypothetical protein CBR_g24410 [Chara braunii]|uniref:Uncharacterized protein n=1 Tax=Chara braunii TaxID=69332 RepID=A0A388JMN2_CHABU|nr:hypothetical protein CBR_g24410 [Chara braunii]|eukprot:GBG59066.1 hypothetical protein CBR_g24410 [Chara braunii]
MDVPKDCVGRFLAADGLPFTEHAETQLEYLNKGTLPPFPVDESTLLSSDRCTPRTLLRSWEEVRGAGALLEWESVELLGPGLSQSLASADGRLLRKMRLWKLVLGDEGSAREHATQQHPSRGGGGGGGGGGSLLGAGPLLPNPPGSASRGVSHLHFSLANIVFGATGSGTKDFDMGHHPHSGKRTELNLRPSVDWSATEGVSERTPVRSAATGSTENSRHNLGFDLDADFDVGDADCMEVDPVEAKGMENAEEEEDISASPRLWQGFGMRAFKARLQRDLGHGHGALNLEAKVNLHCWRKIPEDRRDHLLAFQLGVLVSMFDFLVESLQTSVWKKGPQVFAWQGGASRPALLALPESSLRRPFGLRLLRGRDRRTPVSRNELSDVIVAI